MARKMNAPCMFCGGNPCECDGQPTKKRSRVSAKKASSPEPKPTIESKTTSSSVESDSGTEDIFGEIPEPEKRKFRSKSHSVERDLSLESALRVLRPHLADESRHEVDAILKVSYPPELDKRIASWRKRHR